MKYLKIIIPVIVISIFSCSQGKSKIEGVWVNKNVRTIVDTLNIKKVKDNSYSVILNSWKNGKKRVKKSSGQFVENVLKLDNKNVLILNEDNELVIDDEIFIKTE